MFRYFLPVILSGGKSARFGFDKSFIIFNNFAFLDRYLFFLFDFGFVFIFVSGKKNSYTCILDYKNFLGPIGGFFSCFFVFFYRKFSYLFIFSVDSPFLNKFFIFSLIFFSSSRFSYVFFNFFFPILLSVCIFNFFFLNFFFINKIFILKFFYQFILLRNKSFIFFKKNKMSNINTFLNLFFLKKIENI